MSRTHKIQRSREAHEASRVWREVYNASLKLGATPSQARDEVQAVLAERELWAARSEELHRTSGVRYGNQRKMRARGDVKARRAERRNLPRPIEDIEGDVGLETKPPSPARSRGPRWTR